MKNLIDIALKATQNSYAPYSNFKVGAAIELDNGEIVTGANFENASYGLTICAERAAIYNAQNQFPNAKIKTLAIATSTPTENPISPCGACREVMNEVTKKQNEDFTVIIQATDQKHIKSTAKELLPLAFKL